jgi:hypothetical protein
LPKIGLRFNAINSAATRRFFALALGLLCCALLSCSSSSLVFLMFSSFWGLTFISRFLCRKKGAKERPGERDLDFPLPWTPHLKATQRGAAAPLWISPGTKDEDAGRRTQDGERFPSVGGGVHTAPPFPINFGTPGETVQKFRFPIFSRNILWLL